MLSDPPHKPRFHALEKVGPAFADWSSFCAYTDRLAKINQRLEREDIQARELRYRIEGKNVTAQRSPVQEIAAPRLEKVQLGPPLQKLDEKIASRLREIERVERQQNFIDFKSRAAREEEQKQRELASSLAVQAKTTQIEAQHVAEVAAQRAARLAAARLGLQHSIEARKARAAAELRTEAECQAQAREMVEKEEERRREAVERIRAAHWRQDSQAEERARCLHFSLALQQKTREQRRVEKGCKEKAEKERAAIEAERARREEMKRETVQMLKTQMEENGASKQVHRIEEILRDRQHISCDLYQDRVRREQIRRDQEAQIKDHQKMLLEQLESQRQRRLKVSDMNQIEAEINESAPVRMDYVRPSHDLIAGLPGLGISHDRARHLEALDKNIEEQAHRLNNFLRSSISLGSKKHSEQIVASNPAIAGIMKRPEYATLNAPARLALLQKQERSAAASPIPEEMDIEGLNAYELIRRRSKNSTVGSLINSFKEEV